MRAKMWPAYVLALDEAFGDRISFADRVLLGNVLEQIANSTGNLSPFYFSHYAQHLISIERNCLELNYTIIN